MAKARSGPLHVLDMPYSGRCKFPIWSADAAWEDKTYCGAHAEGASRYCDVHLKLVYQPNSTRRTPVAPPKAPAAA